MLIVVICLLVLSFIMIIISIATSGDSKSFSGALVGSSDLDLFKVSKERGGKKFSKWLMFTCGISLMFLSILIRVLM